MATLSGRSPKNTFPELLKLGSETLGDSLVTLETGSGVATPLKLSSTDVEFNGIKWPTSGAAAGKVLGIAEDGVTGIWVTQSGGGSGGVQAGPIWEEKQEFQGGIEVQGQIIETIVELTGTTIGAGSLFNKTLNSNISLSFPAMTPGRQFTLFLNQNATGGWSVTFPSTVRWAGGATPSLSYIAGRTDVLSFICDGTRWYGFLGGLGFIRA